MKTTADVPVPERKRPKYRCDFLVWDANLSRVRRCWRRGGHRLRGEHFCGEHRNRKLAIMAAR